jgi:hypothetical protein
VLYFVNDERQREFVTYQRDLLAANLHQLVELMDINEQKFENYKLNFE